MEEVALAIARLTRCSYDAHGLLESSLLAPRPLSGESHQVYRYHTAVFLRKYE